MTVIYAHRTSPEPGRNSNKGQGYFASGGQMASSVIHHFSTQDCKLSLVTHVVEAQKLFDTLQRLVQSYGA